MSNEFRRFTQQALGTHKTEIFENNGSGSTIILGFGITNTSGAPIIVDVELQSEDSTIAFLAKNVTIPSNDVLELISGNKIIMESGDVVSVVPTGSCDVIVSTLFDVSL